MLCAEDNPYARVVLNTILVELGHRVDFAGTGDAAIAAVNRGGYDLVLMDVTLPGMDGLAATRAIRALQGDAAHVPIIGISGRTEAADQKAALAAGHERVSGQAGQPGRAGADAWRSSCLTTPPCWRPCPRCARCPP